MANLIVNGDFATGVITPWVTSGGMATPPSIVDGALDLHNQLSFTCCAEQTFTTTVAGEYTLTGRLWSNVGKTWHIRILPELDVYKGGAIDTWVPFSVTVTLPAGVTRTLTICHGDSYQTHGRIDDVKLLDPLSAFAVTVDAASSPTRPTRVIVANATPGQVFKLTRETSSGQVSKVAGNLIADGEGAATLVDFLYPLDETYRYKLYDSTGVTLIWTTGYLGPIPSGGQPWVRDVVFPETRTAPVWIVDVAPRSYPGRITPYTVVGQRYRITAGDVRSGSNGSLTFLCFTHEQRDKLIATLSTGNPCVLKVPLACRSIVDEMTFAPVDIDETRFGKSGWCLLDVDFIEVDSSELPAFQAVTYGIQTNNAAAASMAYSDLSAAFVGKSYVDLYRSTTGIAP